MKIYVCIILLIVLNTSCVVTKTTTCKFSIKEEKSNYYYDYKSLKLINRGKLGERPFLVKNLNLNTSGRSIIINGIVNFDINTPMEYVGIYTAYFHKNKYGKLRLLTVTNMDGSFEAKFQLKHKNSIILICPGMECKIFNVVPIVEIEN